MNTDRDYADIVNPYVRAEQEAHAEGYREGFWLGMFVAILFFVVVCAIFYRVDAHAQTRMQWWESDAYEPIKASHANLAITVCQQTDSTTNWHCYGGK